MKPHAFVAMPVGTKPKHEGTSLDVNRLYAELIQPARENVGCEVFRADEEPLPHDTRADMFPDVLVAIAEFVPDVARGMVLRGHDITRRRSTPPRGGGS